jgi:hypothetical protein
VEGEHPNKHWTDMTLALKLVGHLSQVVEHSTEGITPVLRLKRLPMQFALSIRHVVDECAQDESRGVEASFYWRGAILLEVDEKAIQVNKDFGSFPYLIIESAKQKRDSTVELLTLG